METIKNTEQNEAAPAASGTAETCITVREDAVIIAPAGRLDTVSSAELKEQIAEYDLSGKDIEMDFTNVEYISSAGLRLLVLLQKQAKAGGKAMTVRHINAVVNEVFRVSGFNKAFTVL